jgi:hypothetical protein
MSALLQANAPPPPAPHLHDRLPRDLLRLRPQRRRADPQQRLQRAQQARRRRRRPRPAACAAAAAGGAGRREWRRGAGRGGAAASCCFLGLSQRCCRCCGRCRLPAAGRGRALGACACPRRRLQRRRRPRRRRCPRRLRREARRLGGSARLLGVWRLLLPLGLGLGLQLARPRLLGRLHGTRLVLLLLPRLLRRRLRRRLLLGPLCCAAAGATTGANAARGRCTAASGALARCLCHSRCRRPTPSAAGAAATAARWPRRGLGASAEGRRRRAVVRQAVWVKRVRVKPVIQARARLARRRRRPERLRRRGRLLVLLRGRLRRRRLCRRRAPRRRVQRGGGAGRGRRRGGARACGRALCGRGRAAAPRRRRRRPRRRRGGRMPLLLARLRPRLLRLLPLLRRAQPRLGCRLGRGPWRVAAGRRAAGRGAVAAGVLAAAGRRRLAPAPHKCLHGSRSRAMTGPTAVGEGWAGMYGPLDTPPALGGPGKRAAGRLRGLQFNVVSLMSPQRPGPAPRLIWCGAGRGVGRLWARQCRGVHVRNACGRLRGCGGVLTACAPTRARPPPDRAWRPPPAAGAAPPRRGTLAPRVLNVPTTVAAARPRSPSRSCPIGKARGDCRRRRPHRGVRAVHASARRGSPAAPGTAPPPRPASGRARGVFGAVCRPAGADAAALSSHAGQPGPRNPGGGGGEGGRLGGQGTGVGGVRGHPRLRRRRESAGGWPAAGAGEGFARPRGTGCRVGGFAGRGGAGRARGGGGEYGGRGASGSGPVVAGGPSTAGRWGAGARGPGRRGRAVCVRVGG